MSQHLREEVKMLALCVGAPHRFFAAAHAGLLWEEREPASFV